MAADWISYSQKQDYMVALPWDLFKEKAYENMRGSTYDTYIFHGLKQKT